MVEQTKVFSSARKYYKHKRSKKIIRQVFHPLGKVSHLVSEVVDLKEQVQVLDGGDALLVAGVDELHGSLKT